MRIRFPRATVPVEDIGSYVVDVFTAGPAVGDRRAVHEHGPQELEMLTGYRPHGRDYLPPGLDVDIRLGRRRAVLAPFVPGTVHLAAEVDDGIAEPVLDQQLAEVIELRVVLPRRGRDKRLARLLEVFIRGIAGTIMQQGFQLGGRRFGGRELIVVRWRITA